MVVRKPSNHTAMLSHDLVVTDVIRDADQKVVEIRFLNEDGNPIYLTVEDGGMVAREEPRFVRWATAWHVVAYGDGTTARTTCGKFPPYNSAPHITESQPPVLCRNCRVPVLFEAI